MPHKNNNNNVYYIITKCPIKIAVHDKNVRYQKLDFTPDQLGTDNPAGIILRESNPSHADRN